ncbi:hypothetical protein [Goodfellowiella coeruleoviolacea]|uniref:Uncharacterized protein n=1 Tax=Goodfellowiella coeruleoviolacea TaxID=334858 RepID=A0AAE3KF12_9PSEU|nr:hypothetical protein [Goodfellowiella coeruleoviolacea]MCP2165891.1 hypothetical protein [Goodfellowiella coeruleoviolacea]
MTSTRTVLLTHRARAMLRAVAEGRGEMSGGCEPDLYVDGLSCCDQVTAHELAHAGLVRPVRPTGIDERTTAELTSAGITALIG